MSSAIINTTFGRRSSGSAAVAWPGRTTPGDATANRDAKIGARPTGGRGIMGGNRSGSVGFRGRLGEGAKEPVFVEQADRATGGLQLSGAVFFDAPGSPRGAGPWVGFSDDDDVRLRRHARLAVRAESGSERFGKVTTEGPERAGEHDSPSRQRTEEFAAD